MLRRFIFIAALAAAGFGAAAAAMMQTVLPSGWRLTPPAGPLATVGTMPQGIALSPDGKTLAVVESGVNPAALRLLDAKTLATIRVIPLKGAFGKPMWADSSHVLVPGAATDAILSVNTTTSEIQSLAVEKGAWPVAVSFSATASRNPFDAPAIITDDRNNKSWRHGSIWVINGPRSWNRDRGITPGGSNFWRLPFYLRCATRTELGRGYRHDTDNRRNASLRISPSDRIHAISRSRLTDPNST